MSLFRNYGQPRSPILMGFGVNVLGTKVEDVYVQFTSRFKIGGGLGRFFVGIILDTFKKFYNILEIRLI